MQTGRRSFGIRSMYGSSEDSAVSTSTMSFNMMKLATSAKAKTLIVGHKRVLAPTIRPVFKCRKIHQDISRKRKLHATARRCEYSNTTNDGHAALCFPGPSSRVVADASHGVREPNCPTRRCQYRGKKWQEAPLARHI